MPSNVVFRRTLPDSSTLLYPSFCSSLGFAAHVGPRRSTPTTGTHTAGSGCCKCPHHCRFPDGTFRVVRAADTAVVANVGIVATVPTSAESRHALVRPWGLCDRAPNRFRSRQPRGLHCVHGYSLSRHFRRGLIHMCDLRICTQCSNNATKTSHLRF